MGRRWLLGLALLLAALTAQVAFAADPQPPYDPRPLMEAAGPEATGPFTFAVFGDSYANLPLVDLMRTVAARRPAFAVTTGDMVALGADTGNWDMLSERAGWFLSTIPTWPVIGNHELAGDRASGEANFARFYDLPAKSYSFEFRRCKFIVLGHGVPQVKAAAFLRQELADRNRYESVFVFRHSPFYTVGSKSVSEVPNERSELTKLFEKYRVTGVFSGHDHIYYRTRRNGVCYVTAGIAGAGIYELKRLGESVPGDAYMGVEGSSFVLHLPGRPERRVAKAKSSTDDWLFGVFVRVDGKRVTAETVSVTGEVWERFSPVNAVRPAGVRTK